MLFKEPQDIADVRKSLEDLPDLVVSDVQIQGEPRFIRFMINTSQTIDETDPANKGKTASDVVEAHIQQVFRDKLETNSLAGDRRDADRGARPGRKDPGAQAARGEGSRGESGTERRPEKRPPRRLRRKRSRRPRPVADRSAADESAGLDGPGRGAPGPSRSGQTGGSETGPKADAPGGETGRETGGETADEAAEKAAEKTRAVKTPVDRFAGGIRVELTFEHALDHDTLSDMVTTQLAAAKMPTVPFDLSNEKYEPGDSAAYEKWVLRIQLPEADVREKLFKPIQAELADSLISRPPAALAAKWPATCRRRPRMPFSPA